MVKADVRCPFAELPDDVQARVVVEAAAAAARAARGGLVTVKTAYVLRHYYGGRGDDGWSGADRAAAAVWLRRLCRAVGGLECGGKYRSGGTPYVMPRAALLSPGLAEKLVEQPPEPQPSTDGDDGPMPVMSVYVPRAVLEDLDALVAAGHYPTRSAAIRAALEQLVKRWRGL